MIMNFLKYLKETKIELHQVVFPTAKQTISYTMVVIIVSILVAVMLGAVDFGLREGLIKLLSL